MDKTWSDYKDHVRKYGYTIRGTTPEYVRQLGRGERVNCIAGIASDGVVALEMTTSTICILRGSLIPNMQQFDGINSRSIAVMDNLKVHHLTPL